MSTTDTTPHDDTPRDDALADEVFVDTTPDTRPEPTPGPAARGPLMRLSIGRGVCQFAH